MPARDADHHDRNQDSDALLRAGRQRVSDCLGTAPVRWLLVDARRQRLLLVHDDRVARSYPISTAVAGLNGRENSHGTPPGVHTIGRKIGHKSPAGTVFLSRLPTGWIWNGATTEPDPQAPAPAGCDRPERPSDAADLILSRILTLRGAEPGLNRGPGCDSEQRYVYIHGTNHEDRLGRPVSSGCIRLSSSDVIDLFARVEEGDPVVVI